MTGPERSVDVVEKGDELRARNAARAVAEAVGFGADEQADVGLVATELATNLLMHTTGGTLDVSPISVDSQHGIRVQSRDSGPGIPDVDAAFGVGETSGNSLGYGLATVNILMDTVEVTTVDDGIEGTHVVADRWLSPEYTTTEPCPYSIGATTKSMVRGEPNGDTFVVKRWNDEALVGVVDGLGHGKAASEAAVRARDYVESHFDQPLGSIFAGTERACKGTRGVVMCLARFDWVDGTVTVANVGNVTATVSGLGRSGFPLRRGVVGGNAPAPTVVTEPWTPDDTMVLHSDGVSTGWRWEDVTALSEQSGSAIANWLLKEHGDPDDDATVVVVTGGTRGDG